MWLAELAWSDSSLNVQPGDRCQHPVHSVLFHHGHAESKLSYPRRGLLAALIPRCSSFMLKVCASQVFAAKRLSQSRDYILCQLYINISIFETQTNNYVCYFSVKECFISRRRSRSLNIKIYNKMIIFMFFRMDTQMSLTLR